MSEFLERLETEIQFRGLLPRGQKILVAVSGGSDSMVLLHALHILAKKWRWKITVAHFNHRLRGRSSDGDEELVRKTAATLKLPVVVGRADVKQFAQKSKLSVEMAARKLRHEFFARAAHGRKIKMVALAHHADDQVELFFLRFLRGAGGEGLAGMKRLAPSPADKKTSLVRPLLGATKGEVGKFARENEINFRDDVTNFSSDLLRNRIRNELLPLLRNKYQPGLDRAVLRLMEIIGAESDFVGRVASSLLLTPVRPRVEGPTFSDWPVAIQRRILQAQLERLNIAVDFELIEQLRGSAGKFFSVSSGLLISRDVDGSLKLKNQLLGQFSTDALQVVVAGKAGRVNFNDVKFSWNVASGVSKRPLRHAGREFFDADKIGGKIILRHWRAGDRFQPIGLNSAAKLQDLFTNAKFPREQRRNLILAATAAGEIFWVEGLRIAENFKLAPQTKRRLVWRWRRTQS